MKQKVKRWLLASAFLQILFFANALEYESYACAFSSNIIETYKLSHTDFDPTGGTKQLQRTCIQLLKSNFQVSFPKDLQKAAENIKKNGDNAVFQKSMQLFAANKDKSSLDIIKSKCLSVEEASDLFFVETEKEKMRIKDLSAWDNGRLIELYRLAVGAGYINKADALTAAKPSIDLLAKTYTSWDDYFAHYFVGKQFCALYSGKYLSAFESGKQAYNLSKSKINYAALPLKNGSAKQENAAFIVELCYKPSPTGTQWESVQKLSAPGKTLDARDLTTVQNIKKKFASVPCIDFMEVLIRFRQKSYRKVLNLCVSLDEITKDAPKDSQLYQQIQYTHAKSALKVSKPDLAQKILGNLPESASRTSDYLETQGRLYMELCGTSSSYDKNEEYKKLAKETFDAAAKAGFKIPQEIKDWLKLNGVRS